MKILQVYKDYYPPVKGGIEGHINLLSNGLKRRGLDVQVLVSNTRPVLEKENIDGITVTKVPQIGRFASAPLNASFPFWLRKMGKNADIIHFHFPNPTAEISALFCGFEEKLIVTYHSDIVKQKRLKEVYSPLLIRFLKKARRIIATSSNYVHSSKVLSQFDSKCDVIPLGIDVSKFAYHSEYKDEIFQIRKKYKNILLFIGRFRYYKGLHILINAMKSINGVLLLIGTGPLERDLREQVYRLGLNEKVIFLGELSDQEMIKHLHACDIFVLPSIQRSEAFGIVQLEAMACSKPIICTELDTGTSFVNQDQKTGLVVSPCKEKIFADAANQLIDDPEKRAQFGRSGLERVNQFFSADQMIDSIIKVYEHVAFDSLQRPQTEYEAARSTQPLIPKKKRIKVLRIISRLNIGGPAIHVQLLVKGLDPNIFESAIVTGRISPHEGNMSYLFNSLDVKPIIIPDLQREIKLQKDIKVFFRIFRIVQQIKPDIIHTHTAKAGSGARTTVFLYNRIRGENIQTVHTFHGHVFHGYFNKIKSKMFILIERTIARLTNVIIAISETQKKELVDKYQIAPIEKIQTIELGFDLNPFLSSASFKGQFRKSLGINENTILIGIIGRLVPIKNHKMFFQAARLFIEENSDLDVNFVVVGDGELRNKLEVLCRDQGLLKYVLFCGWIRNVAKVYADLDVLALTSLNEGTPVSIIEAMASSVPVVASNVGGVPDLLGKPEDRTSRNGYTICERGILCKKNDPYSIAAGLKYLVTSGINEGEERVDRARNFVGKKYTEERLIKDIELLYLRLMKKNKTALKARK